MTNEREMMADAYAALERANDAEQARNRHQQEAQKIAQRIAALRAEAANEQLAAGRNSEPVVDPSNGN